MDNKAQMVVMESIIFSIMVVISLAFLINLSPTSIQSSTQTTTDLKTRGDDALAAIYATQASIESRGTNPVDIVKLLEHYNESISKLEICIITNNSIELTSSLNALLPNNVHYNIYIEDANGNREFWCNKFLEPNILPRSETVFLSHHIISMDPQHFTVYVNLPGDPYGGKSESSIKQRFIDELGYFGATYDVVLEMWTI